MENLKRYTTLSSAIHILKTNSISLLSPDNWDDKNDRYFMEQYKKRSNLSSLYALCFSMGPETYHMWRTFAYGFEGICINFNRDKLISKLSQHRELLICRPVSYKTYADLRAMPGIPIEDIPFIKRTQYKDEEEYRIIYKGQKNKENYHSLGISPDCINSILFNPWIPTDMCKASADLLKSINGYFNVDIRRSPIIDSAGWRNLLLEDNADDLI